MELEEEERQEKQAGTRHEPEEMLGAQRGANQGDCDAPRRNREQRVGDQALVQRGELDDAAARPPQLRVEIAIESACEMFPFHDPIHSRTTLTPQGDLLPLANLFYQEYEPGTAAMRRRNVA
jgi:hypothetical protein